jgi:hypothetical protein
MHGFVALEVRFDVVLGTTQSSFKRGYKGLYTWCVILFATLENVSLYLAKIHTVLWRRYFHSTSHTFSCSCLNFSDLEEVRRACIPDCLQMQH